MGLVSVACNANLPANCVDTKLRVAPVSIRAWTIVPSRVTGRYSRSSLWPLHPATYLASVVFTCPATSFSLVLFVYCCLFGQLCQKCPCWPQCQQACPLLTCFWGLYGLFFIIAVLSLAGGGRGLCCVCSWAPAVAASSYTATVWTSEMSVSWLVVVWAMTIPRRGYFNPYMKAWIKSSALVLGNDVTISSYRLM